MEPVWTRVEGMIIGRDLDPMKVAQHLRESQILAQLEWFSSSPQLLGLNVAVADGAVATVAAGESEVTSGPSVEDLAEEIAVLYDAEVRIGTHSVDHLPQGESPLADAWPADEIEDQEEPVSRIVEIGRTPASSVPLLAALEGIDLGSLELSDDHRALLAELPPEKAGWNFGDVPLVTLSMTDGEFQVFLVTDDHLEHIVAHNWDMDSLIVAGGNESPDAVAAETIDLVGDRPDLRQIATYVPGADVDALVDSTKTSGEDAVWKVVHALGLPSGVAGFLLGALDIDHVEEVTVHRARGVSNAIGRSVDIMLGEPESRMQPLWNSYENIAVQRPWLIHCAATFEAIIGSGLLVSAVRAKKPRSGLTVFAGIAGSLMIVDSLAELSLAKYVARRRRRNSPED
ncbi:hypothetical protein G7Y41_08420 [Schaalia sp. ZJ405]|uniref:hypothetical protein n=1 Tax=unclassified Schaalia TaxID=2691889 RepID=UPI0013EC9D7F|nr:MULTISPECIES: hypothetical protein [unclassified Schaalia]QPK81051.1 hypothetical protein G7Y41_08420 [Schaalia sp. ZJ405]